MSLDIDTNNVPVLLVDSGRPSMQSCAVAALKAFIKGYLLSESAPTIARTTSKYLQILKGDANPAAQRGAALALGALPYYLLEPVWKDAVDVLCAAIRLKVLPGLIISTVLLQEWFFN